MPNLAHFCNQNKLQIKCPNRRKWHFRGSSFQNFPGEDAPGPLYRARAFGARVFSPPTFNLFLRLCLEYGAVVREQIVKEIVERAPNVVTGKEFYLPHSAVVREGAETTKTRIVYDASAPELEDTPSLNDCLLTGPPLHNQLWSVLVRNRFHPIAVAGDIEKAFLQVRVREPDRDVLRFHWIKDVHSKEVEILRFTRVVFGLTSSPFLLNGVIARHLELIEPRHPETVAEMRKSMYVDDLISGAPTTNEAAELKQDAIEIFDDAKFSLHKWHSNARNLNRTWMTVH